MKGFTNSKWEFLEYYTVWCEDTGKFEDVCLIFFTDEKNQAVGIATTNPILPHNIQVANARRICQCVNGFDKLLDACKEFANAPKRLQGDIIQVTMPRSSMRLFNIAIAEAEKGAISGRVFYNTGDPRASDNG